MIEAIEQDTVIPEGKTYEQILAEWQDTPSYCERPMTVEELTAMQDRIATWPTE